MTIKSKQLKIQIRVASIFAIALLVSFLADTDAGHWFLGDSFCNGAANKDHCDVNFGGDHSPQWHWGFRHWLLAIAGLILATIGFIDAIPTAEPEEEYQIDEYIQKF